jgi:hypothetical protein
MVIKIHYIIHKKDVRFLGKDVRFLGKDNRFVLGKNFFHQLSLVEKAF